jgi:hypothetical protein
MSRNRVGNDMKRLSKAIVLSGIMGSAVSCGAPNMAAIPQGPRWQSRLLVESCGEAKCFQILMMDTAQSLNPGMSGPDMVRIAGRTEKDMIAVTYPGIKCEQITGNRPDVVLTSTTETISDGARRTVLSDRITMSKEEFCSGGYDKYLMEERPAKAR